jgi:hypothetical protein
MKKPVYLETVEYAMLLDLCQEVPLESRSIPEESDSRDLWKAQAITTTPAESQRFNRRSDF